MSAKHTPGPWYVGTGFSDQGRHIYAAQKVRDEDGEEWHPLIAVTDDDERLVDWQANAQLIAAAPDLLEELRVALVCAEVGLVPEAHTLAKFRAAIAKATGETR
jgi:hypothetical protein